MGVGRGRTKSGARVAAVVVLGLGWLAIAPRADGQVTPVAFEALASADAVRVTVRLDPSILVPELVDLGAPTAQVRIDSLGNSSGFAAAPFPGDLLLRGPALLLPTIGLPPDFVPPYPAIVESEHPTSPEGHLELPGYELATASTARTSTASASLGGLLADGIDLGAVRSTATTTVEDDGTVVARSSAVVDGMRVPGLSVARIETVAEARATDVDQVTTSGGFAVHLLSAAGIDVVMNADGLVLAGQRVPFRLLELVPLGALLGIDGLTLDVLPEVVEDGAIRSAALRLVSTTVLTDGIPFVLPAGTVMTVEIVLGQARASAGATVRAKRAPDPAPTTPGPTVEVAPALPAAPGPTVDRPPAPAGSTSITPRTIITTTAALARWSLAGSFLLIATAALGLLWGSRRFRLRGAVG